VPSYREIATLRIGRPLREDEVVHHVNGDRCDNDPGNLVVMTREEHSRLHSSLFSGSRPNRKVDGTILAFLEREAIVAALVTFGGNRKLAAARLGISLRKLQYRLAAYGMARNGAALDALPAAREG
jgi:DNA-binding NtrC family response regulator